jgi:hypothetical protein
MSNPLNIADYREMMRRDHEFLQHHTRAVLDPGEDFNSLWANPSPLHFGNHHWSPFSIIPFDASPLSSIFSTKVVAELQIQFDRKLNEHIWGVQ